MGFNVRGIFNGATKGIVKSKDTGVTSTSDKIKDRFDLENPDGVQSPVSGSDADANTVKSNQSKNPLSQLAGKAGSILNANNAVNGEAQFYKQEVDSISYEDAKGFGPRPYSLFNKYSLVNFRGSALDPEGSMSEGTSKRLQFDKIDPNTLINPSASKIIELTDSLKGSGYRYSYADFALTKYFGKIPNNMMVTLRRFPFPCGDDIISPTVTASDSSGNAKPEDSKQADIARAVTWLGEAPGNNIADIIQFSHGFNWKEAEADTQVLQSQQKGRSGGFGSLIESNRLLSAAANAAQGRDAYDTAVRNANAGYDAFSETYPNHVFGPLNVIKNVLVREQGLTFNQEFTLKFEYELRDLGGANPKILMLDQLANLLTLTYNNAPFWGGDVRYIGDGAVGKPLGDIAKIKSGDYSGFLKSVVNDLTGGKDIAELAKNAISKGGLGGKTLNNLIGGSLAKMFNSPQGGQAINALLTGDATGQWHVTLGNPLNPIAVMGNLACTNTKINFDGGMGMSDFPEKMIVEVSLKPARPRDKTEIESMFNMGRGRFYIQPADGKIDPNRTQNVSAYGNKDIRTVKIANG